MEETVDGEDYGRIGIRYFRMDDDIICLSDDDAPLPVKGNSLEVIATKSATVSPAPVIILTQSPPRSAREKSIDNVAEQIFTLSPSPPIRAPAMPARVRSSPFEPAAKLPRIERSLTDRVTRENEVDDIMNDLFGGGRPGLRDVTKKPSTTRTVSSSDSSLTPISILSYDPPSLRTIPTLSSPSTVPEPDTVHTVPSSSVTSTVPGPSRAVSDGPTVTRKRRTKEEIEKAKLDKLRAAIEREASAAKKSKAETYLYCRVGKDALQSIVGLEAALRVLMADRKIDTQLEIKDSMGMRVEWWRKSIEAIELEEGRGLERVESMIQEPMEIIVMDSSSIASHIKKATIEAHVQQLRASMSVSNALLVLLSPGKINVKDSERDAQALLLHQKWKTQIREVHTANEAALFICQMHRSIANNHQRKNEKIIADVPKGQQDRVGLVADWWLKMLGMIPRLVGTRALANAFPNPVQLVDRISREGVDAVTASLADVRTDIGNRVGPKRARTIIDLLTTVDGMEAFT